MTVIGRIALAATAAVVVGGGFVVWRNPHGAAPKTASESIAEDEPAASEPTSTALPPRSASPSTPTPSAAPSAADLRAGQLMDSLIALLSSPHGLSEVDQGALAELEAGLLDLGERAVPAVIARLDRRGDGAPAHERLFHILRRLPGAVVDERLATEAVTGKDATRAMAIESLGERHSPRSLAALEAVVRNDPNVPARAIVTVPRDPNIPSMELPDVQIYTPRMQAMAALAQSNDPRAPLILGDVVRDGPDESLRMQAAVNLESWRGDPDALEALRAAASSDPSPYVRLAALQSLRGATDGSLAATVGQIALADHDAGVRALAQQVLASLPK